jgi:hypothetical protein
MKELVVAAMLGLCMGGACLPGLLHDAKRYCDLGYALCVERHATSQDRHGDG